MAKIKEEIKDCANNTHRSVCEVGEMRKRMPLGAVSWAKSTLSSEPKRWVAKPN